MVRAQGYGASYSPCSPEASDDLVAAYAEAAAAHDLLIAETGAWTNPITGDEEQRKAAMDKCVAALDLAERLGARCCVNIAGSRNPKTWDGPHPDNLSPATFDLVVESVRAIIDAVKPKRTFYTLEPMPYMLPDSADSYLALLEAIGRKAFAAHFDPVNMLNTPAKVYDSGAVVREFYEKLGPHIRAIHIKDVVLRPGLTVHIDEVRPGLGTFDCASVLTGAEAIDPDMPILVEHLPGETEYALAAAHVREQAEANGVPLR